MGMRSNSSSQRYSAWRNSSMLYSPRSLMPSCLRTVLPPPSQPTIYDASIAPPGGADLVDDSHAPEDFHGARIAPFHLRQELRRFLLLDQRAAHPAHAEIDGERKTDRAAADDERLRVHRAYSALSISAYLGQNEENWTGGPQAAPTRKLPSPVSSKSPSRTARSQRAVRIRPPKQKKWTPAIGGPPRRAMSLTTAAGPASTRRRVITRGRALRVRTEFPIPQSAANRSSRGKLAGPGSPTRTGSPRPFIFAAHTSTGSASKQNCVTTCRSRPVRRARLFFAASAISSADAATLGWLSG